jgi:hypothetical protein
VVRHFPAFSLCRSGELVFNEAECYATLAHFLFRFRRHFLVNSEGILVCDSVL